MTRPLLLLAAVTTLLGAGCTTVPPKDYTAFRRSNPRSILVLPPLNESTDVAATYSVLTSLTRPLAELGYYVFPVAVVDRYLKENGLTVPGEMHQAPLAKLHEVFGADAVLYVVVEKYGTKYQVIVSNTTVQVRAKLVDARSGVVLWEGKTLAQNGGHGGLIEAVVAQVVSKLFDEAHGVAVLASHQLVCSPPYGLLRGPRHPEQNGR